MICSNKHKSNLNSKGINLIDHLIKDMERVTDSIYQSEIQETVI